MKMQLITIRPSVSGIDNGFKIKRQLFDNCGLVDTAYCNVNMFRACESGFIASGFASIYKPTIVHDMHNSEISIHALLAESDSKSAQNNGALLHI